MLEPDSANATARNDSIVVRIDGKTVVALFALAGKFLSQFEITCRENVAKGPYRERKTAAASEAASTSHYSEK